MVPGVRRDDHQAATASADGRAAMMEELSDELAAYYREALVTHGSVFGAGNCSI
jgi:hypothetical protein